MQINKTIKLQNIGRNDKIIFLNHALQLYWLFELKKVCPTNIVIFLATGKFIKNIMVSKKIHSTEDIASNKNALKLQKGFQLIMFQAHTNTKNIITVSSEETIIMVIILMSLIDKFSSIKTFINR